MLIRRICAGGLALVLGAATAATAIAQEFPSQPIEVVTHASAGGGTDTTARMMLIRARRTLGTDAFVNIRRGGGGSVAMSYFMENATDGHTVLAITPTHLFTMARGEAPMSIDDVVGVARATDDPIVIMVRGDSDVRTLEDLAAVDNLTWGGTQIGGVDHIAAMSYAKASGKQISYVPFDGGGEILTNLIGGNIVAAGLNVTEALEQLERGDLHAVAVMSEERIPFLQDTPTLKENGMDVVFSTVRGYLVKADTPPEQIAYLEEKLLSALNHDTFQNYLTGSGLDSSSVAGREVWDAQMRALFENAQTTMRELGLVE